VQIDDRQVFAPFDLKSHQKETPWITKVIHGVFNPFGGYVITAPGVRSTGYSHGS
jgi:hypothetical protein